MSGNQFSEGQPIGNVFVEDAAMMEKLLVMTDMDGTLFDTFEVNYLAYQEALKQNGLSLSRLQFEKFYGRHYKDFLAELAGDQAELVEKIHAYKKQVYGTYLSKTKRNDMLCRILDGLKGQAVLVLVTTASRKNVDDILEYFGMQQYFDQVVTQEDVTRVKPDPECYEMVMKTYGAKPDQCVIFEDSEVGICAARKVCHHVFQAVSF